MPSEMMNIPQPVQDFITTATVAGSMVLPYHYPALHEVEGFQVGYRYHGITGEDLVSTKAGGWQPEWYVIAGNYFDDPYFVDFSAAAENFPVYYAAHGAGKWVPVLVATNITRFATLLVALKELQQDNEASLRYLEDQVDLHNELWEEVYAGIKEEDELMEIEEIPVDPDQFIQGSIVITSIGENKMKVIQFLKERMGLSGKEALELSKQTEITVAEGNLIQLKRTLNYLETLGASAVFRAKK
jgi:ribosomal protein L7/L12